MVRTRLIFVCTGCGHEVSRWQGQCPGCREWNTLTEERQARGSRRSGAPVLIAPAPSSVVRLGSVPQEELGRWRSGIEEFDFVLGGGIVPGSMVLIGGEPGIGKSTLLLQVAARLVASGRRTLYVSGEESVAQIRMRANRLTENAQEVRVLAETEFEAIAARLEEYAPEVLLIDSIQTIHSSALEGVAGSVGQVRECAALLQRIAKATGAAIVLVGHVTKGGGIAGPKTLEHIVDTVLYFEGAANADHRVLRATKNRFGGVDEIGVFRMQPEGLVAVGNPSELFLGERNRSRSGYAVSATLEGSRTLLVEVQALASPAPYGAAQRVASGFDHKRLALILAVLEKRSSIPFGQLDAFVNVVGGFRLSEPAADAAVAVALASSARDLPVRPESVVVGELGLGGELRPVGQIRRRLAEAAQMGFRTAFVPAGHTAPGDSSIEVRPVADLEALLSGILG